MTPLLDSSSMNEIAVHHVSWYHFNFMPFVRFWVSKATFLLISRKVLFRKSSLTYLWIAIVTCIILGVFLQ